MKYIKRLVIIFCIIVWVSFLVIFCWRLLSFILEPWILFWWIWSFIYDFALASTNFLHLLLLYLESFLSKMMFEIKLILILLERWLRWFKISHIGLLKVLIIGYWRSILLLEELLGHLIIFLPNSIQFSFDIIKIGLIKWRMKMLC